MQLEPTSPPSGKLAAYKFRDRWIPVPLPPLIHPRPTFAHRSKLFEPPEPSVHSASGSLSLRLCRLSHDHKRSPKLRIGFVFRTGAIDHRQHGLPQRLGMGKLWIARDCSQCADHQFSGCLIIHAPVRDNQRSGARIEEGARKARQRFRAGFFWCRRVASGQHHPVGIKLELRDLARGQKPVVELVRHVRERERQGRLRLTLVELLQVSRNQPMGGKIDDPILVELRLLDGGLGCIQAEPDIGGVRPQLRRDFGDFLTCPRQLREILSNRGKIGLRAAIETGDASQGELLLRLRDGVEWTWRMRCSGLDSDTGWPD